MLIGNILSVGLLTYLVMPWVSRFLNFWLTARTRDWMNEALGLSTVAIGLVLFVLIFQAL